MAHAKEGRAMANDLWRGKYSLQEFLFEGRRAILVFPEKEKANGKWLLKTECFSAFQDLEEGMVGRGFHLAYLENSNRWGIRADLDAKFRFRNELMARYDLSPRCVLLGMSCGGLHAIKQAAAYPEMVSVLYADAPVVNLMSCPFGNNTDLTAAREEALNALGLSYQEMLAYREHPLDKIPELIAHGIPLALVAGDSDPTVPFDENGIHLKNAYEPSGLPFYFLLKPGCAHHPHGPDEAHREEVLDFLTRWA